MTAPAPAPITLTPAAIDALADIYRELLARRAARTQTQEQKP